MNTKENNLDRFEGKNPFTVPEGYMEGLTANIMSQLPEKSREEAKKISMMDRVRPWLYMAAVFAGLGLFFRAVVFIDEPANVETLLVKTDVSAKDIAAKQITEDEEYLEYLETKYAGYILAEEMGDFE